MAMEWLTPFRPMGYSVAKRLPWMLPATYRPGMPYSTPVWRMVENYESVYAELLAGRGMFLCPMIYPAFPAGWHIPLHLSLPDTRLLTLRDDPRPEICTLRKVFAEVYAEREKLIKALRDAKTPPCNIRVVIKQ